MENKLNCKLKPSKTLIKSKFIQQKLKARSSFFLFVSHFQFSTRSPHQILHIHLQLEGTACCILHLVPWMCSIGTSNDDHNFQSSSIPSSSSIKHIPYIYIDCDVYHFYDLTLLQQQIRVNTNTKLYLTSQHITN